MSGIRKLDAGEFLAQFAEVARARIRHVVREKYPDAVGVVCFECEQMDSSAFGARTAVVVGPSCTYRSVEECEGGHLFDLPSQRQYPTSWVEAAALRAPVVP